MREKFRLHISLYDDNWSSNNKLKASAITWNQVDGKWITSNNNYQIKEEDLLKLGLPKLNNDTIDLQDKKIYRFPKLTLPRNKVELLKEKYNCKIVRDLNKADISVVSLKLFDTILERTWNADNLTAELKLLDTDVQFFSRRQNRIPYLIHKYTL